MKISILLTLSLCMLTSCVPPVMECFLNFSDYTKTYEFEFSKEELKKRIIDTYSYDESLFFKNLGRTVIEDENVNKKYRPSIGIWLDKSNWDKFKSEIRSNLSDTLNLIIGKHQSRKQIAFQAIIQGDHNHSSLSVHGFKYKRRKACTGEREYYNLKLSGKIERKFINKLNYFEKE
ncbi:MAG TPA: hypothetical protein VF008_08940 [Niastella sp.]